MDDNARPHRANIVDECLQSEDITRMDWPAYSTDLNPIEHVWDMLGRRIAAREPSPTCLPELRRALLDEWCNIPQDQNENLILGMPRRFKFRSVTNGFNTYIAKSGRILQTILQDTVDKFKDTSIIKNSHDIYVIKKVDQEETARGGRVRSTTPAEDRYIVLSAKKRNRRTTDQQVANQFLAASGKQISRKTVARRLRGGGLYARRPVMCVPLTRQHRTARLQWCLEHHNWTEQDWACVLFSEVSRFSLSSDCRRQMIWRDSGTAYRPENIQEKDRYPTCSIMVWAGIMINGRTRLHVAANGTMTGQRYIDEVLLLHVHLSRGAVGDKFVFMDDNAKCHRTLTVHDCLHSEGIQRLVWPARPPDLNPIENVWDALERQVTGQNYPPTNKNTLIRALTEEWDKLPQQLLDNVVQSMVRRVECCITLHGRHIPY
ncbi:transposable element Tcb2 transposase [Trichonephila clavipes]|uniref:Transposable element Tcb2 transposase n=1 Tax=Trichonephila clavipes TaxID=2585209 RepID=A0A8X6VM79_TRICX|nr:transposable element Tcb2 transposase [Trichonephila clavipes]